MSQGPTVWQACLSQLAAHLLAQGEDPQRFVFLAGRTYFNLFALRSAAEQPTSAYSICVFGEQVRPLALTPAGAAELHRQLNAYAFPFAWDCAKEVANKVA